MWRAIHHREICRHSRRSVKLDIIIAAQGIQEFLGRIRRAAAKSLSSALKYSPAGSVGNTIFCADCGMPEDVLS